MAAPQFKRAGTYACTYSPGFKCDMMEDTTNKISRITETSLGKKFLDAEQIYRNKPDLEKYVLLSEKNCMFNADLNPLYITSLNNCNASCIPEALGKVRDTKNCFPSETIIQGRQHHDSIRHRIKNIIMKDGGISLYLFMQASIDTSPDHYNFVKRHFGCVILFFINFLIKLYKYHIIHGDLKTENVLVNQSVPIDENNPYKTIMGMFKIIDFDFSKYRETINVYNLPQTYFVWPLEYIIGNYYNAIKSSGGSIIYEITRKFNDDLKFSSKPRMEQGDIATVCRKMYNEYDRQRTKTPSKIYQEKYSDKYDIFSVGGILNLMFSIYAPVHIPATTEIEQRINLVYRQIINSMIKMDYDDRATIQILREQGFIIFGLLHKDTVVESIEDSSPYSPPIPTTTILDVQPVLSSTFPHTSHPTLHPSTIVASPVLSPVPLHSLPPVNQHSSSVDESNSYVHKYLKYQSKYLQLLEKMKSNHITM